MEFQCHAFGGKDQEVKTQVVKMKCFRDSEITLVQIILLMDPFVFLICLYLLSFIVYCHLTL